MIALSARPVLVSLVVTVAMGVGISCVDSSTSAPPDGPEGGLNLDSGTSDTGSPDSAAPDSATPDSATFDADTEPTCVPPTKGPTMHNQTITANETWTADNGPHVVTFDVAIKPAATVTIEPCAEVRIDERRMLSVEGKLVAKGTAKRPISFVPNVAGKKWGYIRTLTGASRIELAYATLEGGGNVVNPPLNGFGVLEINGGAGLPDPILSVDHVTISGSANLGIILNTGAFAPGSTALTITGSAGYPIRSTPRVAGTIPAGTYTGNGKNAIFLGSGQVSEDATYRDHGVPYELGDANAFGTIRVATLIPATNVPLLTIEPGVTMKFRKNVSTVSAFYIGSNTAAAPATGALVAVGTAAKRITFTSLEAAPVAGDWLGLFFSQLDPRSKLDFVDVRYAGAPSGASSFSCTTGSLDYGSILILGGTQPATQFVTNTNISDSLFDGIGRGYTFPGTATDVPLDMMATNTFTNVARCKQSFPRPSTGGCPAVVPCP